MGRLGSDNPSYTFLSSKLPTRIGNRGKGPQLCMVLPQLNFYAQNEAAPVEARLPAHKIVYCLIGHADLCEANDTTILDIHFLIQFMDVRNPRHPNTTKFRTYKKELHFCIA